MRSKRYYIKELSEDGLVKDIKDTYGDNPFNSWGYDDEESAWLDIERNAKGRQSKFFKRFSYIVITEWTVELEER